MSETAHKSTFAFKGINSSSDMQAAIELITRVYKEEGFIEARENANSAISDFLKAETATVFGAFYGSEVIGTISVIEDGERGLPMDVIFKEELAEKREEGLRIAEVCQFAVDKDRLKEIAINTGVFETKTSVSMGLLKLALHFGLFKKLDFLSLTINPRHRAFYEALGCRQIGVEKQYPSVNNAPALAYLLDLRSVVENSEHTEDGGWIISEILNNPPKHSLFGAGA